MAVPTSFNSASGLADFLHQLRLKLDASTPSPLTAASMVMGAPGGLGLVGPRAVPTLAKAGSVLANRLGTFGMPSLPAGPQGPDSGIDGVHSWGLPHSQPSPVAPPAPAPAPTPAPSAAPSAPPWWANSAGMGHPAMAPTAPAPAPAAPPQASPVPMPQARPASAPAPSYAPQDPDRGNMTVPAAQGPQFNPATGSWGYPTSPTSGPELIQKMMSLLGKKTDNA